jgi:hypothetical protein
VRSPATAGLVGPSVPALEPRPGLRSTSPETTERYKSRRFSSGFSRVSDRSRSNSGNCNCNRDGNVSRTRYVERSAERRAIRPVPAPSLWGGRGRRQRREQRGAGRGTEDGNPYRRAERAQRATSSRTGCRKPYRRPATAGAATGISSTAGAMARRAAVGSEVKGEAARPAAQRLLGASSPERAPSANRRAHRLDRPSDPPVGSQRKAERPAGDRREPASERRRWSP